MLNYGLGTVNENHWGFKYQVKYQVKIHFQIFFETII